MARIQLVNLAHSYRRQPRTAADYALRLLNLTWEDGGAYALLGPSGCGKTTLLNIISGLIRPTQGQVLFDGRDVTALPADKRGIAQVFQFPVVYDSMTVHDNLAFPLRNGRWPESEVKKRVQDVAEMLELESCLHRRARGLEPEQKQKISLGRGLVRPDVAALLLDEPLTMIDPRLKWLLRRQLKEIHRQLALSLIYVTHDQTEALTFADRVMVMTEGEVVQAGTAQELFEQPAHTFVGTFIGNPGMNFLPCGLLARMGAQGVLLSRRQDLPPEGKGPFLLGIRPELVKASSQPLEDGHPAEIVSVQALGTHTLVCLDLVGHRLWARIPEPGGNGAGTPGSALTPGPGWVRLPPEHVSVYANGRRVS
jgi:glycerol transport system ATP-binding protein